MEQFAYRRVRQNNDDLYHPSSTGQHHPPPPAPLAPRPPQLAPRPTTSTSNSVATTSASNSSQPVIVSPMQLGPLVVGEKILLPAGIMRIQQAPSGDGAQPVRMFTASPMVLQSQLPSRTVPICSTSISFDGTTTISQPRRTIPKVVQAIPFVTSTSQQQQYSNSSSNIIVTNSSATPDSGIQSVPTSPPSPSYIPTTMTTDSSFLEDHEDYADMPILRPADEAEEDEEIEVLAVGPTTSVPVETSPKSTNTTNTTTTTTPALTREDGASHGSECETAAIPAISITPTMDSDEIVNRLLALDPEKANAIAMLIKKKTQQPRKRKSQEAEVSSTTTITTSKAKKSRTGRKSAPVPEIDESIATVSTSTDPEEVIEERKGRRREIVKSQQDVEEEVKRKESQEASSSSNDDINLRYRLAIQKQLEAAINREIDACTREIEALHVQQHPKTAKKTTLRNPFMRKKKTPSRKSPSSQKREERKSRFSSRRNTNRTDESPELESMEGRFNGEYEEIPRSIASCEEVFSFWRAPSLSCGCTRGACTSDVECLNRALRVQCNSECTLTLCANKKFWKEDTSRLCVSNGPKSKRFLKTRGSRRAGELLCEYAGEVITSREALKRYANSTETPRILAIGSRLSIDATKKGNVGRFVRHSCRPNSRLEVWSINGVYRAGIFALFDLSSNCEITIDKTGLLPLDTPCNCGLGECKKIIRAARNCFINSLTVDESDHTHRRFLSRNRRRTIMNVKTSSGLPAILFTSPPKRRDAKFGMRQVFEAVLYRIRNIDGSLALRFLPFYSKMLKLLKSPKIAEFQSLMKNWLQLVDDDDIDRAYIPITNRWLPQELLMIAERQETVPARSRARSISTSSSLSPSCPPTKRADADLTYLKSKYPIGSYDPDAAWDSYKAKPNDNAVRCICGALEEDGDMVQCDSCHFWLHIDCVDDCDSSDEYKCDFCLNRVPNNRPNGDVRLKTQPDVRFDQCVYYKALSNRRGVQVRLNETVYVNKRVPEEHKVLLRNLKESNGKRKATSEKGSNKKFKFPSAPTGRLETPLTGRHDARIFRVERLFVTPGNNRFVFGSFYAWPHETYVDTTRMFSKNEVFPTPMYDTLPLDEVIGRCMVIDADTWRLGRPKVPEFKEDDVFLVEHQLGKNQRCFEKVPLRNQYPINTQPYVFEKFNKPRSIIRDFRPYDRVATPCSSVTKIPKIVSCNTEKCPKIDKKLSKNKHK